MKVLMATKTWAGDHLYFLAGAFERKWQACAYPFDAKWLMLNNGIPPEYSEGYKTKADRVVDVEPLAEKVLEHFKLTKDDFDGGYYYSIAELTCLYLAEGFDYLCWVQGDCLSTTGDWVTEALEILEADPGISVVSPYSEVNTYGQEDHFFSDQAFVVRVAEFRRPIYNLTEPELPEYPSHGGNSFERMCGRYLHASGQWRRILMEHYYEHPTR